MRYAFALLLALIAAAAWSQKEGAVESAREDLFSSTSVGGAEQGSRPRLLLPPALHLLIALLALTANSSLLNASTDRSGQLQPDEQTF
jgi:hypothetical protein